MALRSSLSARSKVKYGHPGIGSSVKQKIILVNKTAAQCVAAQKVYDDTITGLKFVQHDWFELGGNDHDDWEDLVLPTRVHMFPLGEEAVLQSHAGSEAIMHQIMEGPWGGGDGRAVAP
ncbi:hypothetical protein B0H14DRAFT_2600238 [Mycena olivaceomarginata]|nr:hypothetical protein B0H14DRAFT_2600238 [Mycena olivaceomarginata]